MIILLLQKALLYEQYLVTLLLTIVSLYLLVALLRMNFLGKLKIPAPMAVLNKLAKTYHLSWYYDGNILYIYKSNEINRSIITPTYLDIDSLIKYLRASAATNKQSCNIKKNNNI